MNTSTILKYFFLILIPILLTFLPSHVKSLKANPYDDPFSGCEPFDCGKIEGISYPFRENGQPDYCGHPDFVIDCQSDEAYLMFNKMSQRFRVLKMDPKDRILKLARTDLTDSTCPDKFSNTTLDSTLFSFTEKDRMAALLYNCNSTEHPDLINFSCFGNPAYFIMEADSGHEFPYRPSCNVSVIVPVMEKAVLGLLSENLEVDEVLEEGFEVEWSSMEEEKCKDCLVSGGNCGYNWTENEFRCFCPDFKAYALTCSSAGTEQEPVPTSDHVVPAPSDAVPTRDYVDPAPSDAAGNSSSTYISLLDHVGF